MFRLALRTALMTLAAVGLAVSGSSYLLHAGRARQAPGRRVNCGGTAGSTCVNLLATRQARLARIPNYVVGAAYYGAVLVAAASGWGLRPGAGWLLAAACGMAFAVSVYLVDQLLRVLRASCPLCLVAHAVNAGLFLVAVAAVVAP